MTRKKKEPNQDQQNAIQKAGLKPLCWEVLQDMNHSMIVKHRVTGEVKVINK